jgi:hypothetical protein
MTVKTENHQRLDLLNLKEGIYFNEVNFGQIHAMTGFQEPVRRCAVRLCRPDPQR